MKRGVAAVLAALAVAFAVPLAGCGEDEEAAPAAETTITSEPTEEPGIVPPESDQDIEPDIDAGGTETPVVPDEGHEGGGPDPGTEEAEQAEENATGGVGSYGGSGAGADEPAPTEAFDQFCEENPEACE